MKVVDKARLTLAWSVHPHQVSVTTSASICKCRGFHRRCFEFTALTGSIYPDGETTRLFGPQGRPHSYGVTRYCLPLDSESMRNEFYVTLWSIHASNSRYLSSTLVSHDLFADICFHTDRGYRHVSGAISPLLLPSHERHVGFQRGSLRCSN